MQLFRVEFQHFFFFLVSGKKSVSPVHRKPSKVNILATCAKYIIFVVNSHSYIKYEHIRFDTQSITKFHFFYIFILLPKIFI